MFIKGRSSPGKPPVDGTRSDKKKGVSELTLLRLMAPAAAKKRGVSELILLRLMAPAAAKKGEYQS